MTSKIIGDAIANSLGEILLKGIAISAVGGVVVEGIALAGARALKENQSTISKVAKFALTTIALAAALVATIGLSAYIGVSVALTSLPAACFLGTVVAIGSILIHWKAFQWAGLLAQQEQESLAVMRG